MATRAPAGCTTWLRVYEPLAAFPPVERARWEAYATAGRTDGTLLDSGAAARVEHAAALAALVAPRIDVGVEHALVRLHDGLAYVCPLDTQARVWAALAEFRLGLADVVADAFVPRSLADAAAAAAEARSGPGLAEPRPPHCQTAIWHVPMAWFLLVEVDEARLVLGDGQGDPARSVTFATTMSAARRRVARALALLRRTIPDAPQVSALESVGRWLEEFHPYSRLEVDYGDLVHVLSDTFLAADTSAADLAEGLVALRAGDGARAAEHYERFVARWRDVQAKETAS